MKRGVLVATYDLNWPAIFEAARAEIKAAIGEAILRIEPIGSTSVPKLTAKPTIDILVGVRDWDEAKSTIAPLTEIGWEYAGEYGIPCRHYFRCRDERGSATHHPHMLEVGSLRFDEHLLFRDHLRRAHAEVAAACERLKRDLAHRFLDSGREYQEGKRSFIEGVLERARRQRADSTMCD